MTKKIVSQNNSETSEKEENKLSQEEDTIENSNNSKETKKISNNNKKIEYIYLTPLKKVKLNIPMAPKKKRKHLEVNDYNIKGKNLLSLFQLAA